MSICLGQWFVVISVYHTAIHKRIQVKMCMCVYLFVHPQFVGVQSTRLTVHYISKSGAVLLHQHTQGFQVWWGWGRERLLLRCGGAS